MMDVAEHYNKQNSSFNLQLSQTRRQKMRKKIYKYSGAKNHHSWFEVKDSAIPHSKHSRKTKMIYTEKNPAWFSKDVKIFLLNTARSKQRTR